MKSFINVMVATLAVLLSSFFLVQAQEPTTKTKPTIATLQAGAKWQVYRIKFGIFAQTSPTPPAYNYWGSSTDQYDLNKLETIDGKSYFVLGEQSDEYYNYTYLREDLNAGKIYARHKSGIKGGAKSERPEYVLFDYNKQVGDTVRLYDMYTGQTATEINNKDRYTLLITAIEMRHIYDADRLVYIMQDMMGIPLPSNTVYWIEGIGYSFGFLFTGISCEETTGGFSYETRIPLCYTAPNGDVYHFHHSQICESVNGYTKNTVVNPESVAPLNVQIAHDRLGLTIRVNDGKYHDLKVYRYDGTTLMATTSFYESYALALPSESGEKILLVIDDETIPYVL